MSPETREVCRVYEKTLLRQVTGELIRPGGLALTDRAMAHCVLPKGAKVLDIGCGTGATTEHLIQRYQLEAVGVDPSPTLIACGLKRNPSLSLIEATGQDLPFSEGEAEGILAECALSVMGDTRKVLTEFSRILKPDGVLILTDVYARNPARADALRRLPLSSCLTGAFSQVELMRLLHECGFWVSLWEDHSAVLKELTAKLILAHGSMDEFWQQTIEGTAAGALDRFQIREALAQARPGYFLLVARKGVVLSTTESVCPVCLQRIPAARVSRDEEMFLNKTCPEHGAFQTVIWRGDPAVASWVSRKSPSPPEVSYTEIVAGCPFDCGLCGEHRQHTCTALLEVTQRCNLHCSICFADAGRDASPDPSLAVVEGWYQRVKTASGPCNIQLSGGEPTMRDDLPEIIRLGRRHGFDFIQINTNGLRLAEAPEFVRALKEAGLASVFLQFDGTEDCIYEKLRGRSLLKQKMAAIRNCSLYNLGVVLVPTLVPGVNDKNIGEILKFAVKNMPAVRGVHFQPISYFGRYPAGTQEPERITIPEVIRRIAEQTEGQISAGWFRPPGCEHELCSFHGSVLVLPDGRFRSLTQEKGCGCSQPETAAEGARNTRRFVARQWSAPPQAADGLGPKAAELGKWDEFLAYAQSHILAISGMAFQDAWNLDLERLKSCCIHVVSPEGKLIPFCAYNLTDFQGRSLYRKRDAK